MAPDTRKKRLVLVTDGASGQVRSTLATVRALGVGGYSPVVTVSGPRSLAAASRYCVRLVHVPEADSNDYVSSIRAEEERYDYLTTIAASDTALLALGARLGHLVDKTSLAKLATRVGLLSPPTKTFQTRERLIEDSRDFEYPVVVKSARPGSRVRRIASAEELYLAPDGEGPFLVQPYLTEPLRSFAGIVWEGRLVAAVHQSYLRTWPTDCGGACAAETVGADGDLEERIGALLEDFTGIFQAQLSGPYLIDLNPRVYGSLSLAVVSGVNLVSMYCDLLNGASPPQRVVRARPGVFYRSLEGDLRHVLSRIRSGSMGIGEAVRALRPRLQVAHGPESLRDPLPMVQRLLFAASSGKLHKGVGKALDAGP